MNMHQKIDSFPVLFMGRGKGFKPTHARQEASKMHTSTAPPSCSHEVCSAVAEPVD